MLSQTGNSTLASIGVDFRAPSINNPRKPCHLLKAAKIRMQHPVFRIGQQQRAKREDLWSTGTNRTSEGKGVGLRQVP